MNPRYGICDNAIFYNQYLVSRPEGLYNELVVKNGGILGNDFTSVEPRNQVAILCWMRIKSLDINKAVDTSAWLSLIIGETMDMDLFLPANYFLAQQDTKARFTNMIKSLINVTSFACSSNTVTSYNEIEGNVPITERSDYAACKFCFDYIVTGTRISDTFLPINWILNMYFAMTKRGYISDSSVDSITDSIKNDLNIDINLDAKAIKYVFNAYGSYVTELNAETLFQHWLSMIENKSLRMKLIVIQARNSGLTSYVCIGRAMNIFNDFNWRKCSVLLPVDFANFKQATTVIRNNPYYGYSKNLHNVGSIKYKSLAYIAKELLIKGNGERSLRSYQGWTRTPAYKVTLDEMISNYITARCDTSGNIEECDWDDRTACIDAGANLFV